MYQSSQLIDALAQPFIRPKLSQQRNYLAQHEETVSIAGVAARLVERGLNNGESGLGGGLEHEIERGRTNLLHGWKSSRESGITSRQYHPRSYQVESRRAVGQTLDGPRCRAHGRSEAVSQALPEAAGPPCGRRPEGSRRPLPVAEWLAPGVQQA